jgi:hypothetical protein
VEVEMEAEEEEVEMEAEEEEEVKMEVEVEMKEVEVEMEEEMEVEEEEEEVEVEVEVEEVEMEEEVVRWILHLPQPLSLCQGHQYMGGVSSPHCLGPGPGVHMAAPISSPSSNHQMLQSGSASPQAGCGHHTSH